MLVSSERSHYNESFLMYNLHKSKRIARLVCGVATAAAFSLSLTGCGDTFRPVVIPNGTPGVDPGTQRTAIVLTQAPATFPGPCATGAAAPCPGTMMQINVGGDTNSSGFNPPGDLANYVVGRGPNWASFGAAVPQVLWMVDRDSDSVNQITPSIGANNTTALPAGSKPVFLAVVPDPTITTPGDIVLTANSGTNSVSIVDGSARTVRTTVPVGANPVAIAGVPAQRKAYVVNEGDGTVSVISTVDGTQVHPPITVGSDPVAVVVNAGALVAYVVNRGSGSVTVMDTSSDTVRTTLPTAAGSSFAVFDPKLLRVYVTNSTANSVSVIDASSINGTVLRTVPLPAGATNPVAVTALNDGTRFYTANSTSNNVTVFDAQSFAPRTNIAVGTNPVFIASSGDSSRVYVAVHDATIVNGATQPPGTAIIRAVAAPSENPPKAADTLVTTIPATFTDPQNCLTDSATCVRTQPVFVISQ